MQKKIIALAVAGLMSGAAFAQSNVQIYGVMDIGLMTFSGISTGTTGLAAATTNGTAGSGRAWQLSSGNYNSSRLGFRGTEDLGGGMKANFIIETNLATDGGANAQTAGNTGLEFAGARQIVTGVSGGFGAVNLGRQYTPFFSTVAAVDPFGATGIASAGVIHPLVNNTVRASSSAMYTTPTMGGFTASVMYGLQETYDGINTLPTAGSVMSWNALYANGPLVAGLAQIKLRDVNTATSALAGTAAAPATGNAGVTLTSTAIGGTYDLGVVKLHAAYNTFKTKQLGAMELNHGDWHLGVSKTMGAHTIKAAYNRANDKSTSNEDANHFGLGYDYALSKRTALYALYAKVSNKNGAIYAVNFSGTTGSFSTHGASSFLTGAGGATNRETGMGFGLRHSF
jgi:predicted porin